MVVTGDVTQVDLPAGASGLQLVTRVLDEIEDIHFARLTSADVVRHSLVGQIVDAYTKYDAERQAAKFERDNAYNNSGSGPSGAGDGANRAERRGHAPQDRQAPSRPDRRWGR
jgi:phosphate starvation-inducible PhoH-like protein